MSRLQPANSAAVFIRRARTADMTAVMALAESASTAARWPRAAYDAFCKVPSPMDEIKAKMLFVACTFALPPQPIGFVAFSALRVPDTSGEPTAECELENMAVAAEWRRQGVGKRLLDVGMIWCRAQLASSLWLEVRASNRSAIALYEQAGLVVGGRRPDYYAQPQEDAILMQKHFS